jgi:SPP1 gp7 family putative phage head morphogenesis protein
VESFVAALDRFLEAATMATKRRAVARLERRMANAFRRYFRAQGRLVLEGMGKLRRRPQREAVRAPWPRGVAVTSYQRLTEADEPLPDLDHIIEELIQAGFATDAIVDQVIAKVLAQALEVGAEAAIKAADVSISFDMTSQAAVDFLQKRAADLVTGINDTSRAALRDLITAAVKDGKSYDQLATAIGEMFDGFSDYRSRMIAVTEIGNAYEEGALLASQALEAGGLVMEKSWLTAGDDRVEEECQGNAEAGWIALGEDFPSGDARPLAHPNCRCTMLSRRKPREKETTQ